MWVIMSTEYMSSSNCNSALDFNLTGRLQLVSFSKEEQRLKTRYQSFTRPIRQVMSLV